MNTDGRDAIIQFQSRCAINKPPDLKNHHRIVQIRQMLAYHAKLGKVLSTVLPLPPRWAY